MRFLLSTTTLATVAGAQGFTTALRLIAVRLPKFVAFRIQETH